MSRGFCGYTALPRLYDSRSWLLYHQAKLCMIQISAEENKKANKATIGVIVDLTLHQYRDMESLIGGIPLHHQN